MNRRVMIAIDASTRDLLKSIGSKGETYDTILRRLISETGMSPQPGDNMGTAIRRTVPRK